MGKGEVQKMTITPKLNKFIRRVAFKAINENPEDDTFGFLDYYKEYVAQIEQDDYNCLVSYAKQKGRIDINYTMPGESEEKGYEI